MLTEMPTAKRRDYTSAITYFSIGEKVFSLLALFSTAQRVTRLACLSVCMQKKAPYVCEV